MKILFCSAVSTSAIKKIMFQCQVYKQHQCSIMFKEIIPTRGCSSLLNKSFSRICVLTFLFLGTLCSFLLSFVRSITVLQTQSPCPKVKNAYASSGPLCPMLHTTHPRQTVCILESPLKTFSFAFLQFVSLG